MATHRRGILNATVTPDGTAFCFAAPLSTQLSLTNASAGKAICFVMKDPAGGGDAGLYGTFQVPKNYVGTPKIVGRFVLDGDPAGTTVGLGLKVLAREGSEAWDTALGSEATASNATWTGYADEDVYELAVSISDTLVVDDTVQFFYYIDDSAHTYTGNLLLVSLEFEYADA